MSLESDLQKFVVNGGEGNFRDILGKLKFISKIQEGEKIDLASLSLMENCTTTRLYRTFIGRNESRQKALEFFQQTIKDAFNLASRHLQTRGSFHRRLGEMLIQGLEECKTGIVHHSLTYSDDKLFIADSEALLDLLKAELDELRECYAHHVDALSSVPDARSSSGASQNKKKKINV